MRSLFLLSALGLAGCGGAECEPVVRRSCPTLPTMMEADELVKIEVVYSGGEAGRTELMNALMGGGIGYFAVLPNFMGRAPKENAFFAEVGRTKARELCSHPRVADAQEPEVGCLIGL